jgi:hypothetical protein
MTPSDSLLSFPASPQFFLRDIFANLNLFFISISIILLSYCQTLIRLPPFFSNEYNREAMPEPSATELAKEAEQEAAVFSQALNVEKLLNMLRAFDPTKP